MVYLDKNKILVGTRRKGIYSYNCQTQQFSLFIPSSPNLLTSLYITLDQHIYTSFMDLDYIAMTKQENPRTLYSNKFRIKQQLYFRHNRTQWQTMVGYRRKWHQPICSPYSTILTTSTYSRRLFFPTSKLHHLAL